MPVTITHSTPADGTFSATGAAAWDATHTVSGLGTMAEQNANNVNITGGSITGVTGVLTNLTVGSTATSGGAAGQIMFDTGTVLQESSNLVWDNTNKKLTITGATVTTSQPVLDMTQTWNAAGVGFTGVKINITKTAANNGTSKYFDLQANSTSKFVVTPYGAQIINNADGFANFGVLASTTDTQICVGLGLTAVSGASNAAFSFGPGGSTAPDTFLTRRGAANLRLGAADAAAPVAQTLSVQSVVAGTSNTAGANLTITGSQGTGTGAGGSIIFQTAPAGTTGTAQNALANALTIDSTRTAIFNGPVVTPASTPNGFWISGNATQVGIYNTGGIDNITFKSNGSDIISAASNRFQLASGLELRWSSTSDPNATADLILRRGGAANLRLGAANAAAPVAQTLSVQSVVAGTSNTAGANLTITGSQGTGTGAGGSIIFQVAPAGSSGTAQNALSTALTIDSLRSITVANNINASNDVNATGNVTVAAGSLFRFTARGSMWATADGVFQFSNNLANGFGRINFGGSTSSFPALKTSSTILQVRLADDSAYAPVEASTVRTATAYTVATLPAAGTAGRKAYVTDATAPTFLGALIGGGTVVCPVFDNGTAWVAG